MTFTGLLPGSCIGSAAPTIAHVGQTYSALQSSAGSPSSMQQADLSAPPAFAMSTSPATKARHDLEWQTGNIRQWMIELKMPDQGFCWWQLQVHTCIELG